MLLWQTVKKQMKCHIRWHLSGSALFAKTKSRKKTEKNMLEIIILDPSIYIMDHPVLTVSNVMGNSIGTKRVKDHSVL